MTKFCKDEMLMEMENQQFKTSKEGFIVFPLIVAILVIFGAIFLVTYIFFFRPFQINGDAMFPTYVNHEYVLTSPGLRNTITRGNVIVFHPPFDPIRDSIRRVIAAPGDLVTIQNGNVYLNNQKLSESSYSQTPTVGGVFLKEGQSVTVPQDTYFVLGDNRPNSSDSRGYGFVPVKNIISKVLFCYWNCVSGR